MTSAEMREPRASIRQMLLIRSILETSPTPRVEQKSTSALVMNCGLPDQQLCPTLHEYQGQTGYFATLLVGKPKQGAN